MREKEPHSSAPDSTGTGMRRRMEESCARVSCVVVRVESSDGWLPNAGFCNDPPLAVLA